MESIGTAGGRNDNAVPDCVGELYKNKGLKLDRPFRTADELELATLSWIHWLNEHGLHSSIGYLTLVGDVVKYYRENATHKRRLLGEAAVL